jgi:hypothetical protein
MRLRTEENELGFLWNPILRSSFLKGVMLPRLCRVCAAPLYWRGSALMCSKMCDAHELRRESEEDSE